MTVIRHMRVDRSQRYTLQLTARRSYRRHRCSAVLPTGFRCRSRVLPSQTACALCASRCPEESK